MFKNKKAQGLSLNTIIIASLVLIVLVVLILVFTGQMGGFTLGLSEQTNDKECPVKPSDSLPCDPDTTYSIGPYSNVGPREYCCIPKE